MRHEHQAAGSPAKTISPRATWRFAYLLGWLVLGAMLAAGARNAHATAETFCVGSSFALGSALITSDEGQSVDLDIRIRQGTYSITTTETASPRTSQFAAATRISIAQSAIRTPITRSSISAAAR